MFSTQNKKNGTECRFDSLEPYTNYTCEIRAKVNTSNTSNQTETGHYIISTGKQETLSSSKCLFTL